MQNWTWKLNTLPNPQPSSPLYEQLVWDYKNTNTELLNRAIETFSWEKLLENK